MSEHTFWIVQPDPGVQLPQAEPFGVVPPLIVITGEPCGRGRGESDWNEVLNTRQLETVFAGDRRIKQHFRLFRVEVRVKQ